MSQLSAQAAPYAPQIAPASDEAELAIKRFQVAKGFKVEVFAAEPMLANPVAFYVDEKGRFFVCETFRLHDGVTDIRGKDDWLDEDLASRSVNDRLAEMKRHLGERISTYAIHSDRLRLIEDRDGDGKADHSSVFADGFNDPLEGIAAGVLARKGNVWFANIPNLWLLRDTNGDGVADTRKSLQYGYGVRIGFLGHDLHGLRFGPDGKLYFSIGDRASRIEQNGKIIGNPDTGCVFRCNPDGSDLEVFAFGLRNPQELAFDQFGNLFTGDNNSDGGDRARFVYVVEGGDSGWRVGYQFIQSPNPRGPWNYEKLWYPQWNGQAAHLVPPIANIADGPSGLTYYPGTGMPERYQEHFFLCDFRGGKGSGIHSFKLQPKGASFELVEHENFLWECLPTDVDFGVNGGIYYTDWVQGWNKTGKGRIYHVFDPEVITNRIVLETKKLIAEGMDHRSPKELARLLAHPDMRIRQEAQFALADKGAEALSTLAGVAIKNSNRFARLHAIWGIGQIIARLNQPFSNHPAAIRTLIPLLSDPDVEVRAQAAKVLGDCRVPKAFEKLLTLLEDSSPRVRFFAALGLGKLKDKQAIGPVLSMLRANADQDAYLRHAGVIALTWINDLDSILTAAKDRSPAVRMGALLAMRRLERPEIAQFLNDPEPALVEEAARAINDEPINGAIPELASLIDRASLSVPTLRRVINVNARQGTVESASSLGRFAANTNEPVNLRGEALAALGDWHEPPGRDRVIGLWRPIPATRDAKVAKDALRPLLPELLARAPDPVRLATIRAIDRLEMTEAGESLVGLVRDTTLADSVRSEALKTLASHNDTRLFEAIKLASTDSNEVVRSTAVRLQSHLKPADALPYLVSALDRGSVGEQQSAFNVLGALPTPEADEIVGQWLDKLSAGQVRPEIQLDLWNAATNRVSPIIKTKLRKIESNGNSNGAAWSFSMLLHGGNAQQGRKVFFERAEAGCLRCHKANGEGGDVGPDLSGVATRQKREYLLESILYPNKQIAAGFESVVLTMANGATYTGVFKSENAQEIVLNSPEDGILTLKKSDIKSRNRGLSAMPEGMENILSKSDIRDLVEFLSSLK